MEKELIKLGNNNLTIDSREVAEMMEIRHDSLLKKIDGIQKDLTDHKIVGSKYWIESSYKDASGKSNREFQITKRGCEFLANKTTGTKGNLFTDKYMDKFYLMENAIRNNELTIANKEIQRLENIVGNFEKSIEEAKQQFKPSHKKKLDYNKMIKAVTNNEEEAQIVKDWVFGVLNINKWEDTCIEDSKRIMEAITTVSKLLAINKFEQLSLL